MCGNMWPIHRSIKLPSIGSVMESLKNILDFILPYTLADYVINPCVKGVTIYPYATSTFLNDLSYFTSRDMGQQFPSIRVV